MTMQEALPFTREVIEIEDDSDDPSLASVDEPFFSLNEVDAAFNDGDDLNASIFGDGNDIWPSQTHLPDRRNVYQTCLHAVIDVFPDICHEHVQQLYDARLEDPETMQPPLRAFAADAVAQEIVMQILDGGGKYPKEKDRIRELKRKRSMKINSDDEEANRWRDAARDDARRAVTFRYSEEARLILLDEFVNIPKRFIELKFRVTGHFYATYLALEHAEYEYKEGESPYTRLRRPRRPKPESSTPSDAIGAIGGGIEELKIEIEAARKYRQKEKARRKTDKELADADAADEKRYRDNGDVMECQCCFDDYPINKLTHCDGDEPHFFCYECAQRNVMEEIGKSRYKLQCMDSSGCKASFSYGQKQRFLDEKTFEALERGQQQAQIRLAQLEGLSSCPFCDFAAICPPIDVDREFRCSNPECEKTSCRLCKVESHTPLTCAEARKENGISERHVVEEARTEALLRTCPKCNVKIIKEDGCNKVICPCGGWLCDYCGKDITKDGYNHFEGGVNGTRPATATRKCPTYDDLQIRRKANLEEAEAEALKKVRTENPSLTEEDLKIKFAEVTNTPTTRDPFGRPRFVNPNVVAVPNAMVPDDHVHRAERLAERLAAQQAVLLQQRQRNLEHQAAIMEQMNVQQNHAHNFARRLNAAMYPPGVDNGQGPLRERIFPENEGFQPPEFPILRAPPPIPAMARYQDLAGFRPPGRPDPAAVPRLPNLPYDGGRVRRRFDIG